MTAKKSLQATATTPHECAPLGTILIDLGARLGVLDKLSRKVMTELLQQFVDAPDDAPEIARLADALATVQQPISKNATLNRLLTLPDARAFAPGRGAGA